MESLISLNEGLKSSEDTGAFSYPEGKALVRLENIRLRKKTFWDIRISSNLFVSPNYIWTFIS
jgi:hypothetical protein